MRCVLRPSAQLGCEPWRSPQPGRWSGSRSDSMTSRREKVPAVACLARERTCRGGLRGEPSPGGRPKMNLAMRPPRCRAPGRSARRSSSSTTRTRRRSGKSARRAGRASPPGGSGESRPPRTPPSPAPSPTPRPPRSYRGGRGGGARCVGDDHEQLNRNHKGK